MVDALRCAVEVQAALAERNSTLPTERRIDFRIGINVGVIVLEDGDIFGDGVNVAVRLEGLAQAGSIARNSSFTYKNRAVAQKMITTPLSRKS